VESNFTFQAIKSPLQYRAKLLPVHDPGYQVVPIRVVTRKCQNVPTLAAGRWLVWLSVDSVEAQSQWSVSAVDERNVCVSRHTCLSQSVFYCYRNTEPLTKQRSLSVQRTTLNWHKITWVYVYSLWCILASLYPCPCSHITARSR